MGIVDKTRNDMPMQMRDLVAKAGQVDFVRIHQDAQAAFDSQHHIHEMTLRTGIQIAHFGDMFSPYDPEITRITGIATRNDATTPILPNGIIPIYDAKWTLHSSVC